MPQRFLRPGIRTSPRWNSISHRAARLYIAILTLVDDYGRYDGRHSVLWADTFAVWNEQNPSQTVSPQDVLSDCQQLESVELISFYESNGRKYLQVTQWQERSRHKSRWPDQSAVETTTFRRETTANRRETTAKVSEKLPPSTLAIDHRSSPSPSPSPSVASGHMSADGKPVNGKTRDEMDVATHANRALLKNSIAKNHTISAKLAKTTDAIVHTANDLTHCTMALRDKLCLLFQRKPQARWSYEEEFQLSVIARRSDALTEFEQILSYRQALSTQDLRFFPGSAGRLLDKWTDTLDRAKNFIPGAHGSNGSNGARPETRLKLMEEAAGAHPANRDSTAFQSACSPERKAEFKKLITDISTLKRSIINDRPARS